MNAMCEKLKGAAPTEQAGEKIRRLDAKFGRGDDPEKLSKAEFAAVEVLKVLGTGIKAADADGGLLDLRRAAVRKLRRLI